MVAMWLYVKNYYKLAWEGSTTVKILLRRHFCFAITFTYVSNVQLETGEMKLLSNKKPKKQEEHLPGKDKDKDRKKDKGEEEKGSHGASANGSREEQR